MATQPWALGASWGVVTEALPWGCSLRSLWLAQRLSPVLQVSLRNSNSLYQCNLYPLSLLFRPVLLSVSSSRSFPDALFLQLSPFLLLKTPYSSHSPSPSIDLSSGVSPFFPLLGWPFLCSVL